MNCLSFSDNLKEKYQKLFKHLIFIDNDLYEQFVSS